MNEPTAKNDNQLVTYKKYCDLNQNKPASLAQSLDETEHGTKVDLTASNDQLIPASGMQPAMSSPSVLANQTISTQVDEQELYQFNGMFENGNQTTVNQSMNTFDANEIYTTKNDSMNNGLINQQTIGYSEMTNMCNANTQIPSIPPSPINNPKDNPFTNPFHQMNQIIEKVDFNNNLSTTTTGPISYPYNSDDQIQLANSCQMSGPIGGNQQIANQLSNQSNQKLFLNPQQGLIANKSSTMVNSRALTRMRSCSGPSQCFSSTPYSNNSFLSNNMTGLRSNSLTPLYEDQKMAVDFAHAAMINKFSFESKGHYVSSSPVSPISEPMSPLFDKKQLNNIRFNKFSGLGPTKKDGSRSASFTSSNSNEPFLFNTSRPTRQRHTSSPYVMTSNYSYSSQSLTNSPTTLTPFNSSSELYVHNNHQGLGVIDNSNQLNSTVSPTNNPGNLNLQENSFVPKTYPFPP